MRLHIGWIDQEAGRTRDAVCEYDRALALASRDPEYLPQLYLNLARATGSRSRFASHVMANVEVDRRLAPRAYPEV